MATLTSQVTGDMRVLNDSSYWLSTSYVDRFANEVSGCKSKGPSLRRHRARDATKDDEGEDEDDDWEDVNEAEGDPTDGVALALLNEAPEQREADDSSGDVITVPTALVSNATMPASDLTAPASVAGESTAPAGDASTTDRVQTALLRRLLEQCVDNWKAAAAESKKKMWKMYEESGVFASACRHGFILWLCDMVRSGEL